MQRSDDSGAPYIIIIWLGNVTFFSVTLPGDKRCVFVKHRPAFSNLIFTKNTVKSRVAVILLQCDPNSADTPVNVTPGH